MKSEWLWDSKLTERQAARILKDGRDPRFLMLAEKLIGRLSPPKKVFAFLDKGTFCQNWAKIKKRLRTDAWMQDKVVFWQVIYEATLEELKNQGFKLRKREEKSISEVQRAVAAQIKEWRLGKGLTQKQFAAKLNVIQPYISRLEKGTENVSLETLEKISKVLGCQVKIKFSKK